MTAQFSFTRQDEMLAKITQKDCDVLTEKERTYKGSWRKRGGVGAFMMLARKWDRLENIAAAGVASPTYPGVVGAAFDIFKLLELEDDKGLTGQDGSIMAEIRDLRRYLALVESYFYLQKQAYPADTTPTQNTPKTVKAGEVIQVGDKYGYISPPPSPGQIVHEPVGRPPLGYDPDSEMEHKAANRG